MRGGRADGGEERRGEGHCNLFNGLSKGEQHGLAESRSSELAKDSKAGR